MALEIENIVSICIMAIGGVLLALAMSIIGGNRKLKRHKECSSREPHIPGSETNKSLRQEIERRIERVSEIKYEPMLLSTDFQPPKNEQTQYYCRMKALDHLNYLEKELSKLSGVIPRQQHETLRGFLMRLTLSTPSCGVMSTAQPLPLLRGMEPRLLHQLCDLHSHARYHAHPFGRHQLTTTHALMLRVLHCGRSRGLISSSEDHLKGPSDHDSAIDTDPVDLDPLESNPPSVSSQRKHYSDELVHRPPNELVHRPLPPIPTSGEMVRKESLPPHDRKVAVDGDRVTDCRSRVKKMKKQRPARLTIQDDEITE